MCPENYKCPTECSCDSAGICLDQLQPTSRTVWFQQIEWLSEVLGHHQVWLLSGHISDQCIVDQWLAQDAEPTDDEKERLYFAATWLRYVLERRGRSIALGWFIGRHLSGLSPGEAIRDGYFDMVEESAKDCAS